MACNSRKRDLRRLLYLFEAIWSLATPVPDDVYKFNYKQKTQKVLDQAAKTEKNAKKK